MKKLLAALGLSFLVVVLMQVRVQWPQQVTAANKIPDELWTEKDRSTPSSGAKVDIEALNNVFVGVAEKMSQAVVKIHTKTRVAMPRFQSPFGVDDDMFRFFFGNPFGGGQPGPRVQESQSLGSGFVINNEGYIVTNAHVIRSMGKNADEILVTFTKDGEKDVGTPAEVIGADESTDVAVIKLKKKRELTLAPLGDSDKLHLGEWVVAIGNPYGYSFTVTKGIVSGLGRDLKQDRGDFIQRVNFIQTDAGINVGNSGGPLMNLYGEVVGINTQVDARAQGIGFAIPINTAKRVIRQLIEKGKVEYGWWGVAAAELSPQMAKEMKLADSNGVMLHDVFAGEPADKAGMKPYDVVIEIDGKKLHGYRDFLLTVGSLTVGERVEVKYIREGKVLSTVLTVGARKSEHELAKNRYESRRASGKGASVEGVGIQLTDLTPGLRGQLGLEADVKGVLVQSVAPQSSAEDAGLQRGDVILEVARKPVSKAEEAKKLITSAKGNVILKVRRGPEMMIVLLERAG